MKAKADEAARRCRSRSVKPDQTESNRIKPEGEVPIAHGVARERNGGAKQG
jgi:hypothetical protein